MLCLGHAGQDQIHQIVAHILETHEIVARNVKSDLLHHRDDRTVHLVALGLRARAVHTDAVAQQVRQDGLGRG